MVSGIPQTLVEVAKVIASLLQATRKGSLRDFDAEVAIMRQLRARIKLRLVQKSMSMGKQSAGKDRPAIAPPGIVDSNPLQRMVILNTVGVAITAPPVMFVLRSTTANNLTILVFFVAILVIKNKKIQTGGMEVGQELVNSRSTWRRSI